MFSILKLFILKKVFCKLDRLIATEKNWYWNYYSYRRVSKCDQNFYYRIGLCTYFWPLTKQSTRKSKLHNFKFYKICLEKDKKWETEETIGANKNFWSIFQKKQKKLVHMGQAMKIVVNHVCLYKFIWLNFCDAELICAECVC